MSLDLIDWILIALYFVVTTVIAIVFAKRAGKSLGEFFLGGRRLPWYIAGISMVATTFAADTPLAVTELVANNGISGNWLWWNMMIGGMLTTFFFARLWRRANVLTEVEFIDLRYSGKPAQFLRGFKSVYLGFFMNILVLGWVNLALMTLLKEFFQIPEDQLIWYVAGAMAIVAVYSSLSGFMGVAVTDMIQFGIAMGGSILLAVIVVNSEQVGGIDGLKEQLGPDNDVWNIFPKIEFGKPAEVGKTLAISGGAFLAYIGFQWWASWYPGAEPGGGGYVAQRMMSAKNEKHSVFATLFFQVAHYALRPWPWILVGLSVLVLYPDLVASGDAKLGYVRAMNEFLPAGAKGLLLVAFLAAYMSTISTQLNWGASYLVNDLYKPFIKKAQSFGNEKLAEKNYVWAGRIITILLMIVSLIVTTQMNSISGVWSFIIECGAGLGLVLILRWFWWRINVWSEISATIIPFFAYATVRFGGWVLAYLEYLVKTEGWGMFLLDHGGAEIVSQIHAESYGFPNSYFFTIGLTTVAWLAITFLTQPEPMEKLQSFYKRVRPGGIWAKVREGLDVVVPKSQTGWLTLAWLGAILMTYSALFAIGKLVLKEWGTGFIWLAVSLAGGGIVVAVMKFTQAFEWEEDESDASSGE